MSWTGAHQLLLADFDRIIKPLLEREPLVLDDVDDIDIDSEIAEIKEEQEEAAAEKLETEKGKQKKE